MIYGTLLGILSNRDDREKFSEYGFFQTYQHKVSGLELFLHELEYQTRYLEELAKLSTDDVLNSMKINWIGAQEDCATLINFLIDNGYIKSSGGRNIYITKHFNFKGKTKDNIKFGGRNISAGKIYVTDKLTIPK